MHQKQFTFSLSRSVVAALVMGSGLSHATTVFTTDFSTIPANLDITGGTSTYTQRPFDYAGSGNSTEGDQDIDVTNLGLSGQWLFTPTAGQYIATVNLENLSGQASLDLGFFLNSGGGLDANNGGQIDGLEVRVDGVTVFSGFFGGRSPDRSGYGETPEGQAAALIRKLGESGAPSSNLNAYRSDGWGHDALYDMSLEPSLQEIPHTASTATIDFIINRSEADTDEYFGLANLTVSTNPIPEPSSLVFSALAAFTGLSLRRRRQ